MRQINTVVAHTPSQETPEAGTTLALDHQVKPQTPFQGPLLHTDMLVDPNHYLIMVMGLQASSLDRTL